MGRNTPSRRLHRCLERADVARASFDCRSEPGDFARSDRSRRANDQMRCSLSVSAGRRFQSGEVAGNAVSEKPENLTFEVLVAACLTSEMGEIDGFQSGVPPLLATSQR